jgi:hypothetical protein
MSFSKVNPPGWAFGDKLTSAQMNQLDADHANALDKSVAGDAIAGVVTIVGAGQIRTSIPSGLLANTGNGLVSTVANGITTSTAQGIVSNAAQGIISFAIGGIQAGVAKGITDGGHAGGISATILGGISDGGVVGGISPTIAAGITDGGITGGIRLTVAGGLRSNTAGAIVLAGGASDYPTFSSTRVITKNLSLGSPFGSAAPFSPGTGWTFAFASGPALVGGATTNTLTIPLNGFFGNGGAGLNGSTLTSVVLVFAVGQSHANVPVLLPSLQLWRIPTASGNATTPASLYSGGAQSMGTGGGGWTVPTTGALWFASGNMQNYPTAPNQNNAIDLLNYVYYAVLQDESGGNALTGNLYYALQCTFGNLTNMAPG